MKKTSIALKKCELTYDLISLYPSSFLLLTQIALRITDIENKIKNLGTDECLIGDYKKCGLTQQKYRTAKKRLSEFGFVKFKRTKKGTIAKLINTEIFDIHINNKK